MEYPLSVLFSPGWAKKEPTKEKVPRCRYPELDEGQPKAIMLLEVSNDR